MGETKGLTEGKASVWNFATIVYGLLFCTAILYVILTLWAANVTTHTSNDTSKEFFTHLSYIVPSVLIWYLAARAALRMKSYARKLLQSDDGHAWNFIANALLLITLYSVLLSIATTIKTLFSNTSYLNAVTIFANHIPVIVLLLSSILLFTGTRKLDHLAPDKSYDMKVSILNLSIVGLGIIIAAFAYHFYHMAPTITDDDLQPHFAPSVKVLLFTYVLPQAITWFLGLFASLNLANYGTRVEGVIYKRLLKDLYRGVLIVYGCTFLAQMLYTVNLTTKEFSPEMLPIFGVLILLVIGYLLIYRGASQLDKLEE